MLPLLLAVLPPEPADPPLADLLLFPPRQAVEEALDFNRAYRAHLLQRWAVEGHRGDAHARAVADTDRLYAAWDTLLDAQCAWASEAYRRQALARLRQLIGPANYCAGRLPPPVPFWNFRETALQTTGAAPVESGQHRGSRQGRGRGD